MRWKYLTHFLPQSRLNREIHIPSQSQRQNFGRKCCFACEFSANPVRIFDFPSATNWTECKMFNAVRCQEMWRNKKTGRNFNESLSCSWISFRIATRWRWTQIKTYTETSFTRISMPNRSDARKFARICHRRWLCWARPRACNSKFWQWLFFLSFSRKWKVSIHFACDVVAIFGVAKHFHVLYIIV